MNHTFKDNWPDTRRRLTALWHGERLDRPCISVISSRAGAAARPLPPVASAEDIWLNPEYRIAATRNHLARLWWGGEAMPSELQMGGWVLCLGGTPHFDERTIWFETRQADFSAPSTFRHNPASIWTGKYHALIGALCRDAGRDDYMIGSPCALPANDLLSMLMGTAAFLEATIDHPDWLAEAVIAGAHDMAAAKKETREIVRNSGHAYWYGNAGWMPFWAPEPYLGTQSDVSCMLSTEAYDRFVLPELEIYAAAFGSIWYHLDGCDARHHLPRLLSLPWVRVVQYTPTPGEPQNGPAHMEMYEKIQKAGKIVHINAPFASIEPLVRGLDPARLMLDTWAPTMADGEKLLEQSVIWSHRAPHFTGEL